MYEHRCLKNIKKLYTSDDKCDNKKKYKYILEAAIVFTPDRFTNNSTMSPGPSMIVKKSQCKKITLSIY